MIFRCIIFNASLNYDINDFDHSRQKVVSKQSKLLLYISFNVNRFMCKVFLFLYCFLWFQIEFRDIFFFHAIASFKSLIKSWNKIVKFYVNFTFVFFISNWVLWYYYSHVKLSVSSRTKYQIYNFEQIFD